MLSTQLAETNDKLNTVSDELKSVKNQVRNVRSEVKEQVIDDFQKECQEISMRSNTLIMYNTVECQ